MPDPGEHPAQARSRPERHPDVRGAAYHVPDARVLLEQFAAPRTCEKMGLHGAALVGRQHAFDVIAHELGEALARQVSHRARLDAAASRS